MTHPLGHKVSKRQSKGSHQRSGEPGREAMPGTVAPKSCLLVRAGSAATFSFLYISSTWNAPIEQEKILSILQTFEDSEAFVMIPFLEIFLLFFKSVVGLREEERHRFGLEKTLQSLFAHFKHRVINGSVYDLWIKSNNQILYMDVLTSSVLNCETFVTHPRTRVQKHRVGSAD